MKLQFTLRMATSESKETIAVDIENFVIAGWAGRDNAAIEHHIEELAELGIPRPSSVPLYYRVAASLLNQEDTVQVVGDGSSGEVEAFAFADQGRLLVSLVSDHTDRKLEAHSVALSKQLCAKPVGRDAWLFDDVADHWDKLVLRSWIEEDNKTVLYQEGPMAQLQPPADLMRDRFGDSGLPPGWGMSCGTVGTKGSIRHATSFKMELFDPVLNRSLTHSYTLALLPEIA